jgi:hypothetical protein
VSILASAQSRGDLRDFDALLTGHVGDLSLQVVVSVEAAAASTNAAVKAMAASLSDSQRALTKALMLDAEDARVRGEAFQWTLDVALRDLRKVSTLMASVHARGKRVETSIDEVMNLLKQQRSMDLASPGPRVPPSVGGGSAPHIAAPDSSRATSPLRTIPWTSLVDTDDAELGRGTFGVVRVMQFQHRRVAVKELKSLTGVLSKSDVAALEHEAAVQSQLDHDNVVHVFALAADVAKQRYGLVMKLMSHVSGYAASRTYYLSVPCHIPRHKHDP